MDAWGWVSVMALAAAAVLAFQSRPAVRWLLTSVPFWMFGNALDWLLLVAVALTVVSMIAGALVPTLVGRRVNRPNRTRLVHLTAGPLVPMTPQVFTGGQRSRLVRNLAWSLLAMAVAVAALVGSGVFAVELAALALAALIMSSTFAFANWFADRVRVRIDEVGVHGRTLVVEHTAKWTDVTGLRLRYLMLPRYGVRMVYYVVESPRHEVAFPSSMRGAETLRDRIEAATGLRWSEPDITATL